MRDDDLCKIIINDMNTYGLAVIDDFLGRATGLEILREVDNMYGAGVFQVSRRRDEWCVCVCGPPFFCVLCRLCVYF